MHASTTHARASKQAERERLVSETETVLGLASAHQAADDDILKTPAHVIVAKIKERTWTSEQVVTAFIRSACAAHRKTNCITEVLFHEALADARAKDAALAAGEKPEGGFYGLPSSFKDSCNIVGFDSSLGCSLFCSEPTTDAKEESSLVKIYRQQGGIPICKTGIPQTLLAFECSNPIWGTTSNPYSSARTCGGSSGGEGAIITLRGSALGWGSDIGGSLRIPAAYSGCCGLKPTIGRFPNGGNRVTVRGFDGIKAVVGPMALTVDELTFSSRVAIQATCQGLHEGTQFQTENVVPIPWREPSLPAKMRIGYWIDDGAVKASPANVRAVLEAKAVFEKLGHEVVEFHPPRVMDALGIFTALLSADGYKQLLSNCGKDPLEPSMNLVTLGPSMPRWVLWLATRFVKYVLKDAAFADTLAGCYTKSASELEAWSAKRDDYIKEFRQQAWADEKLDFLLCPPQAVPALEHGRTKDLSPLCVGTALFNVVDSTAGIVPVTRVDAARDAAPADYAEGHPGSWLLSNKVYASADPAYNAEKMAGLPVAVQIVGRQFTEENVLAVMKLLEDAVDYK